MRDNYSPTEKQIEELYNYAEFLLNEKTLNEQQYDSLIHFICPLVDKLETIIKHLNIY